MRRLLSLTLTLSVGAFVLACDDAPSTPGVIDGGSISAANTTDDIPEKTTGDVYARGGARNLNHFVFNAHMGTDSKDAKGNYEFEAVDVGWTASGSVTYVESDEAHEACFCGILTEKSSDSPASDYDDDGDVEFCVGVEDNGEPASNSPVDLIEGAFEGAGPDRGEVDPFEGGNRCDFMDPYTNEVESGNLQVHDNK